MMDICDALGNGASLEALLVQESQSGKAGSSVWKQQWREYANTDQDANTDERADVGDPSEQVSRHTEVNI